MFDEATSNLDSTNERLILNNLNLFILGKTVVIIAHRLSTVMNAGQILVLEKSEIVEIGNHRSLTANEGIYENLIKH